jgi:CheY-like chemotaxis protein
MGRRVLIVDDNADHAQTLRLLLMHYGHDVRWATTALHGLELVEAWSPEFILLDIGMPEVNGYQAVSEFRRRLPDARIYALTGYGSPEDRRRALEAGFDEHFVKTTDVSVIEKLLSS